MTTTWFKKIGWIYLPTSIVGFVITLLHLVFFATVFIAIDRNSHSVSDTLYNVFPYFISVGTILFWIAHNTSKEKN